VSEYDDVVNDDLPNTLGLSRKREPVHLPNLTEEELAKVNAALVIPGGPRIPDAPDISPTPPERIVSEEATDEEFFVGGRYKPEGRYSRTNATFEVVEHTKEPQHVAFDQSKRLQLEARGIPIPPVSFYVKSPRGTIGWVPWIGSSVVWPWDLAWEVDMVERSDPDPKPGAGKKK